MATASAAEALTQFVLRFARRSGISLAIFLLSYVPYVGRLVLPAASFYTFNRAVGLGPACVIFGSGLFLPRRYLVMFLQAYFASRSLTRELLDPYLSRVQFTPDQKRAWFHAREGILFGFGVGFWILLRIPLVGVLIYGIAEASTAYLITKITDPPPPPSQREAWAQTQTVWRNKHEFLSRSLWHLDDDNNHDGGHTTPTAQPPPPDEPPSYEEAMRTSATASGYDAAAAAELRER